MPPSIPPAVPAAPLVSPPEGQTCQNCGFRGAGRYCQECSQSYATHRISLHELLHEVFHFFTHLDKGFPYTLQQLLRRPGTMQREYLAGQRVRYQKPFSAFVVAATLYALGMYAIKVGVHRLHGVLDEEEGFFRHYFVLLQAAMLPAYALVTWLFFRRSQYNYAEIGVVVLYSLALVLLLILPINALKFAFPHFETGYLELPLLWGYNTLTYFRLFPGTSRWVLLAKSLLINSACFALSRLAADAVVAVLH